MEQKPEMTELERTLERVKKMTAYISETSKVPTGLASAIQNTQLMLNKLIISAQRYPEKLQKAMIELAEKGWYLDWNDMSLREPERLMLMYSDGQHEEVEDLLVAHYRRRNSEIEIELSKLFPNRAHIFQQAFSAHQQGLYYLSVPTLLAQADGIYCDFQGQNFFQAMKSKPSFVEGTTDLDSLTKALLAPFAISTSIRKNSAERGSDFMMLNRHSVLHGESLDYGTEVKSLQAIAFLYYVAFSVAEVLERRSVKEES